MHANPRLYDYVHRLHFADDSSVEMTDGAGQVITMLARGTYTAREVRTGIIEVRFDNLVEIDPYYRDPDAPRRADPDHIEIRTSIPMRQVRELPAFTARCTRERGRFAFREQVIWRVTDELAWPCLIYDERYVFDSDPLSFGEEQQTRNLYYQVEAPTALERARTAARYYYPSARRQTLLWRDLVAAGIAEEDLTS